MALSKTKVSYSLNQQKMKEKKASEKGRARQSLPCLQESAEQREERLAKRRVRDRARRAAQTVEQRQALSARQTR